MSNALKSAMKAQRIDLVKKLVDNGANVDEMRAAIILSSMGGYTKVLEMLLGIVDNMNANDWCESVETALIKASWIGYKESVRLLLEKGRADINAKDKDGEATALMKASFKGHIEIVLMLLEKGADINEKNEDGDTALMWASTRGRTEVVTKLLEKGADVNAKADGNLTALMSASSKGQTEVVRILLENEADVNVKDLCGQTALMMASEEERHANTVALIKKHIRIKQLIKDTNMTALIVKKGITREEDKLLVPYAQRETIRHIASFF